MQVKKRLPLFILILFDELVFHTDTVCGEETIDLVHLKWLKEDYDIDCGLIHADGATSSRVINGRLTKQVYPWVVDVSRLREVQVQPHANEKQIYRAGGTLITETAIVTGGSCICDFHSYPGPPPMTPCLADASAYSIGLITIAFE